MDIYAAWPTLKIPRKAVMALLKWPWLKTSTQEWPPRPYSWSSMNERSILLWLSTQLDSVVAMREWLEHHAGNPPQKQHLAYIDWLYGVDTVSASQSTSNLPDHCLILMPVIYAAVERCLLWDDPSPVQPSDMTIGIKYAQKLFQHSLQDGHITQAQKDTALTSMNETGWSVYQSETETRIIQTVYDTLLISTRLNQVTTTEVFELADDVKQALAISIENFWLHRNHGKDWSYADDQDTNLAAYKSQEHLSTQSMFKQIMSHEMNGFVAKLQQASTGSAT